MRQRGKVTEEGFLRLKKERARERESFLFLLLLLHATAKGSSQNNGGERRRRQGGYAGGIDERDGSAVAGNDFSRFRIKATPLGSSLVCFFFIFCVVSFYFFLVQFLPHRSLLIIFKPRFASWFLFIKFFSDDVASLPPVSR